MSEVVVQTSGGTRLIITPQAPRPIVIRRPGDMLGSVYDPQGVHADAFDRANHTGTQTLATISDAGTMAAEAAADYTKTADLGDAALLDVGTTAGTVAAGDHTHADATTSVPGFMSAVDKAKLDGLRSGPYSRGHLWGLTLSNNASDVTNDIDIAIGEARDETDAVTMTRAAALTKRLDANWAAGTNQGGRYSGAAIANGTYHVWLVSKAGGADVDVYLDPSAVPATVLAHLQAETGGASYLYVRRIGSVLRASNSIVLFTQIEDKFYYKFPITDRNSTADQTSTLLSLSVPDGLIITPIIRITATITFASGNILISLGSYFSGSAVTPVAQPRETSAFNVILESFVCNTSRQVYFSQFNASGTPNTSVLATMGYIDTRGRVG